MQKSHLSDGVAQSLQAGAPLPTLAKALVNRMHVNKQNEFLKSQQDAKQSNVVKAIKKAYRWSGLVHQYTLAINKVLESKIGSRNEAVKELIASLNPTKYLKDRLQTSKFLDGTFRPCHLKQIAKASTTNPGAVTCCVCKQEIMARKQDRILAHFLTSAHHKNCKALLDKSSLAASQVAMKESQMQTLGAYISGFGINKMYYFYFANIIILLHSIFT